MAFLFFFAGALVAWGLAASLSETWRRSLAEAASTSRRVEGLRHRWERGLNTHGWLVTFLAAVLGSGFASGHPIFGLLAAALFPLFHRGVVRALRRRRTRELEASALPFLHGLKGLLEAGIALPQALFVLARAPHGAFGSALRRFLDGYGWGRPLGTCLASFREQAALGAAGALLAALEVSYARGLPIVPLLAGALPPLEARERARRRTDEVMHSLNAQMGLVAALPWALFAFLVWREPVLGARFLAWSGCVPVVILAASLELAGWGCLRWLAKFY